jgi:hypothetical protein
MFLLILLIRLQPSEDLARKLHYREGGTIFNQTDLPKEKYYELADT